MSKKIAIYTIAYSEDLLEQKNGFLALDNTQNERPDWREYWPIRNFLLNQQLDDECYYGFFSPRFHEKTGLGNDRVVDFINNCPADTDAVVFSPQPDIGAFFPSVFAGEEQADPGFLATSQRFVDLLGLGIDLPDLVMDSSTIVFSNYLAARPRFWKIWLEFGERLFEIAENQGIDDQLRKELLRSTNYAGGVQRKVFLMERLASLVLVAYPDLRVRVFDPFVLGWSAQLNQFRDEAVICDSLKVAINQRGFPAYRQVYDAICKRVIRSALGMDKDAGLKADPLAGVANADLLGLIPAGSFRIAEIAPRGDLLPTTYLDTNPDAHWGRLASVLADEPGSLNVVSECDVLLWEGALENEQDPVKALCALRSRMKVDAALVISFGNARHWRFQAQLALGIDAEWPDSESGLSSRRRFTRPQFYRLLDQCGFRVDAAVARVFSPPDAERYLHNIGSMARLSGGDAKAAEDDARVLQYVVRARANTPFESSSSRPASS